MGRTQGGFDGKRVHRSFQVLKRKDRDYKASKLSPSPEIDLVWHALILHTELYITLCGGRYIHHRPAGELEGDVQKNRYRTTLKRYREEFDVAPPSPVWPRLDDEPPPTTPSESDIVVYVKVNAHPNPFLSTLFSYKCKLDDTIGQLVERFAVDRNQDPDKILITYGELGMCSNKMSTTLRDMNISSGAIFRLPKGIPQQPVPNFKTFVIVKDLCMKEYRVNCCFNEPIKKIVDMYCFIRNFDPQSVKLSWKNVNGQLTHVFNYMENKTMDDVRMHEGAELREFADLRGC